MLQFLAPKTPVVNAQTTTSSIHGLWRYTYDEFNGPNTVLNIICSNCYKNTSYERNTRYIINETTLERQGSADYNYVCDGLMLFETCTVRFEATNAVATVRADKETSTTQAGVL